METYDMTATLKTKLESAEDLDDVVKVCRKEGIGVTKEQLEMAEAHQNTELTEDDLDNVSSGCAALVLAIAILVFGSISANCTDDRSFHPANQMHI